MSKMHKAAKKGDTKAAKKHMKKGVGLNAVDENGLTPLHVAAESGQVEFIKWLAAENANLDARDNLGMTALLRAVMAQQEAAALALIQSGANPDIPSNHDVTVWARADSLLPKSVVNRMRSEASLARAKRVRGNVYLYQEPSADTVRWEGHSISLSKATGAGASSSGESPSVGSSSSVTTSASTASPVSSPTLSFASPSSTSTSSSSEFAPISKEMVITTLNAEGTDAINLDEVTEAVSQLIVATSAQRFGVIELEIVNTSLKPLSVALRNMSARAEAFASRLPQQRRNHVVERARRVSDSIRGLAPAVRSLNEDPGEPGPHKTMIDVSKRLLNASYAFYVACVGGVSDQEIAQTIQDTALATKTLLKAALTPAGSDLALQKAYRLTATNTVYLLKILNTRMVEAGEVDHQHKVAESSHVVGRATEALIISCKAAFASGDPAARGNLATLAKALADQYHKVTDLTTGPASSVTPIPTHFDEAKQFLDAFKQLSAAAARSAQGPQSEPLLHREQQVVDLINEMVAGVKQVREACIDPIDSSRLMEGARAVAAGVSRVAAIALNTARYCENSDPSFADQLTLTLQNALYFSMQLKLAASARALRVQVPTNFPALAYSLRGIAACMALIVEAKLF